MNRFKLSVLITLIVMLFCNSIVFADVEDIQEVEILDVDITETDSEVAVEVLTEDPSTTPTVTPNVTVVVTPTAEPEVTLEITPEITAEVTPEVSPEMTPEVSPEVTLDVTPEMTPEVSPEVTPEVTPELSPEVTPVVTTTPSVTPKVTVTVTPTEVPDVVTPTVTPEVSPATPTVTVTPSVTPTSNPTDTVTPTVEPTKKPVSVSSTADFVERLYSKCLSRKSDTEGKDFWTKELVDGNRSGCNVAAGFVFSPECKELCASDDDFLNMLYASFFDREPDEGGFNYWTNILTNTTYSREYVFASFVCSDEFTEICEDYGIIRGSYDLTKACDLCPDVAEFAGRLYTSALDRKFDRDGIEYWTNEMMTFEKSPLFVAKCFFDSQEFKDACYTDNEYIRILYNTCMGRSGDMEGVDWWLEQLDKGTYTRDTALEYFLSCEEFQGIMETSGVVEKDIVTVAKTQIGESGGLKYCNWYGYRYRIEWCACFVSWCANECGYINDGTVPMYKWCMDAKDWFVAKNQWVSNPNYRPKSGDIIFFDWNHNGVIDHTGIVVGTEPNGRIHTVEGNKEDVVKNDRVFYVGDPDICGYGVPAYK